MLPSRVTHASATADLVFADDRRELLRTTVRARYVAELHEIKQRYVEWEIIGPPEICDVNPDARYFAPHFNAMMSAELRRFRERPPELHPTIDALEVFLVRLFTQPR